ncbi:hypothetical protein SULI_14515 [Saccharolobus solfataricus]|uniref:Tetratricopeptide repeat protein n=3 Tax=Saccharolobus solfataricus TaxID=2287 RepID=Q7LX86_SACS2|nr:hypothetical protein [Saccharolobus solfataricus]AAK42289.1 Hypothetical protein SSO2110 [Saccharolobus solfataricus P2]AKA74901.1 hypothetical protein SULB_2846 [Saccharolobus solfataricus]AKA77597.1 hypothetical protein SULC_2843 [Saccharolobus solfataricus]AKA80287.1 hypothetical protein SULA_2845 [Saccharolobus solfataricus]AZF69366.1 hypothetical protein SULG_14515 [Saccharolobus solfataricus]
MDFKEVEELTRGLSAYERRFAEIYYYLYRASENILTKDELDEYYKILKRRDHSADHLVKLAEVYLIMGDKDTMSIILQKNKRIVEDKVLVSNTLILLECLSGRKPTYSKLALMGVIAECSHLLEDYDPMEYFMRLLRDNPSYNTESNISEFLRSIAIRFDKEPARSELVEDALMLNERVKREKTEKILNNYTLAVALRGLGRIKESEKFVESLREGLKKYDYEFYFSAHSLVSYHSIFNEIDEVDKLIDSIERIKHGDKTTNSMMRALSANTAYIYTNKERYLDIALEAFQKLKGDVKINVGIIFLESVDKPDILFNIINEITAESNYLFYLDEISSSLGIAYANIKDNRILELMNNAPFYRFIFEFILSMAGQSVSNRLKISLSFI